MVLFPKTAIKVESRLIDDDKKSFVWLSIDITHNGLLREINPDQRAFIGFNQPVPDSSDASNGGI